MDEVRALKAPFEINLELTTKCPLHCPQCYVSLNTGREMPLETALYWLRDAAQCGVKCVNLSGGETMCYPHLMELIEECKRLGMSSNVALSGALVTEEKLREMIEKGVGCIFVSLNGSTRQINEMTRDGYDLAVNTLRLLKDIGFPRTFINWVMHSSNAADLPAMAKLAEDYGVCTLAVLAFKPDSAHELKSFPSKEQLEEAADFIRSYRGPVKVHVESCFSQLRALVKQTFFGSLNYGILRGCAAGRIGVSVTAEGLLTPCRHLDKAERFEHLIDYWNSSVFLKSLREAEENRKEPCLGCRFEAACLPCMAVGMKLRGELNTGMPECPLAYRNA